MIAALVLAGAPSVVQTWIAGPLVPDPSGLLANSLAAQAATAPLLFAMARDRQLPAVLKRCTPPGGYR